MFLLLAATAWLTVQLKSVRSELMETRFAVYSVSSELQNLRSNPGYDAQAEILRLKECLIALRSAPAKATVPQCADDYAPE